MRGLAAHLAAQDEVPIEFWGWADGIPFRTHPPHSARWLPRMGVPRTRFPRLLRWIMWARSAASAAAAVHITDPNALVPVSRGRLMTTVYDLIPLHDADVARPGGYDAYLNTLRSARSLFAISQATADDVVATLRPAAQHILVARPGVEVPKSDDVSEAPIAGKFFLYVGSPDRHKNVDLLIEALRLSPEIVETLVIAGKWPENDVAALTARAASNDVLRGRVKHLGYVDDTTLQSLYRHCTAAVVPSLIEGFGLPVAEAMAAGAAVVHSKIPVLEEASAGAALTFSPTSVTELSACLQRISSDPGLREDLVSRGLHRAQALTWGEAVATTLAEYRQAIEGPLAG
ncbi:MAG TPA: glycosyltransferase family 1 protein [Candidatus Dormibacteraeota bacterium]|nr:glycosyltransferase family 1 protein [Candidatus Dormibacteraeota bacterium]